MFDFRNLSNSCNYKLFYLRKVNLVMRSFELHPKTEQYLDILIFLSEKFVKNYCHYI